MANFWNGFIHWIGTVEFGSAADWFTGLLTAGTLFLAVTILRGDRRRSRRAAADAFSTWPVYRGTHAVENMANYTVELHAYNAGDRPIPFTLVMVRPGSPQHALQTMSTKPIPPQTEIISEIGFDDSWHDSPLLLMFRDARGRSYLRDITTNKYVSKRQIEKWYRLYGKTELGMYHYLFTSRNGELIRTTTEARIAKWNEEHPPQPVRKHGLRARLRAWPRGAGRDSNCE